MKGADNNRMISLVIPAFNEEENVEKLSRDLNNVLIELGDPFEIIFVNDGSKDNTMNILKKIRTEISQIKILDLLSNSGQTAATLAGFENSSGDIIITMDSDLQHYPEDIPAMIAKLDEGWDCVGSWRYDRKSEKFGKRFPSKISNILAFWLTGTMIHDFGSGFKAYRSECVKGLQLYGSFHRYIPAIVQDNGFTVSEIRIEWRERYGGKTKYGTSRLIKGIRDLIFIALSTRFKRVPGTKFLRNLMIKVNYDHGRPTFKVKDRIGF